MNFLGIFKRKKEPQVSSNNDEMESIEEIRKRLFGSRDSTDYLGLAATCEQRAMQAIKDRQFDDAWRLLHEQKQHYLAHASRSEFTAAQTFALEGSVSEHLANILRLEGKHDQALVHLLYLLATSRRPTVAQEKKLPAYVNRAKLPDVSIDDVRSLLDQVTDSPDFSLIQSTISGWTTNNA